MNIWTRKSLEIARSTNYLDQLSSVYPIPHELNRPIDNQARTQISDAFTNRNHGELIRLLITQKKFPILDPYLGSLREDDSAIERNPDTIQRIARILYTIGLDKIIEGIEEPPQANRQLGQLFSRWLHTLPFPFLDGDTFMQSSEICFHNGAEQILRNFANDHLGMNIEKSPDLLAKSSHFVIGEAKFLTSHGGNQDKSFREVMGFVSETNGNAIRIGILDGVVWFCDSGLFSQIQQVDYPVMTALLLPEYLQSLNQENEDEEN